MPIPIKYKNLEFDEAFRADLIVENKVLENKVLVELKASETNHPVYYRQLFSYLKLTSMRFGLLMNFGSEHLKDGIKRVANGHGPSSPLVTSVPSV